MPTDATPMSRLMSPKEAAFATSLSRPLLTLMAAEGQFPCPVRLGERRIAFVRAEVDAWIDSRIAARPANDNHAAAKAA